jgi:hypothetical protein
MQNRIKARASNHLPNLERAILNAFEIFALIIGYFHGWAVVNLRDNLPMTFVSSSG